MMCTEDGARILGCIYEANGEKITLAPGESKEFKNTKYFCQAQQTSAANTMQSTQQMSSGSNTQPLQSQKASGLQKQMQEKQRTPMSCTKNGQNYANGEQFQTNQIRYQCHNGYLQVTGCYNGLGESMNIGQEFVGKNNMVYRCSKASGQMTVEYEEHSCGYRGGPSCSSSAADKQSNKMSEEIKKPEQLEASKMANASQDQAP